jgi:PilZ domain
MTAPCTILIAAPDRARLVAPRVSGAGELFTFDELEALEAFDLIVTRRPRVVAVERTFALTARGASLINRIKIDPALGDIEIRVVSADMAYTWAVSREGEESADTAAGVTMPLDQRGTRRTPRVRMTGRVEVQVDGNPATLIDLSRLGAQIVCATRLRPSQRIRLSLPDDESVIRCSAAIAWAWFEMVRAHGPHYRVGMAFNDPEPHAAVLEAFCGRYGQSPDPAAP